MITRAVTTWLWLAVAAVLLLAVGKEPSRLVEIQMGLLDVRQELASKAPNRVSVNANLEIASDRVAIGLQRIHLVCLALRLAMIGLSATFLFERRVSLLVRIGVAVSALGFAVFYPLGLT